MSWVGVPLVAVGLRVCTAFACTFRSPTFAERLDNFFVSFSSLSVACFSIEDMVDSSDETFSVRSLIFVKYLTSLSFASARNSVNETRN